MNTPADNEQEKPRVLTRAQREEAQLQEKLDNIAALRGDMILDIVGYVYRKNAYGKMTACPKIGKVMDDDEIGMTYGPGDYQVSYIAQDSEGKEIRKTVCYSCGPEYRRLHLDFCRENGIESSQDQTTRAAGFSLDSLLQKDKVESIAALAALIGQLFKRDDAGSRQLMELMKIMAAGQRQQQFPDQILNTLLSRAIEPPRAQNPIHAVKEQLSLFRDLKELTSDQGDREQAADIQHEEKDGGPMDIILKSILPMLPGILQSFQGNAMAAARSFKANPMVQNYVKNPDKQRQFYKAVTEKFGKQTADDMVRGFDLDPAQFAEQQKEVKGSYTVY